MPRNGSGVYTPPPIYLATPGTTIQAQQHNDPITDMAAALTGSVASDGQTPMTGVLNANGNKITGLATATNPSDAVRFDQISDPSAVALATLQTYGWAVTGNSPTVANIDATNIASGQYRFVTGATGTFPTGVIAADTGQIIMIRETVNEGSMIMAVGAGRVFWRALVAGVWGAWQEYLIAPASAARGTLLRKGASAWQALALGTNGQVLQSDGTDAIWVTPVTAAANSGNIALSGAGPFGQTGIPATARKIRVFLEAASLSGTDNLQIQIGDSGGYETTGYLTYSDGANSVNGAGFFIRGVSAATANTGVIELVKHPTTNNWSLISGMTYVNTAGINPIVGTKLLSATLDRIQLMATGANTFDAGNLVFEWE